MLRSRDMALKAVSRGGTGHETRTQHNDANLLVHRQFNYDDRLRTFSCCNLLVPNLGAERTYVACQRNQCADIAVRHFLSDRNFTGFDFLLCGLTVAVNAS